MNITFGARAANYTNVLAKSKNQGETTEKLRKLDRALQNGKVRLLEAEDRDNGDKVAKLVIDNDPTLYQVQLNGSKESVSEMQTDAEVAWEESRTDEAEFGSRSCEERHLDHPDAEDRLSDNIDRRAKRLQAELDQVFPYGFQLTHPKSGNAFSFQVESSDDASGIVWDDRRPRIEGSANGRFSQPNQPDLITPLTKKGTRLAQSCLDALSALMAKALK